jgi:hypothetical protein
MRLLLAACISLGVLAGVAAPKANADVVVGVPGLHVDIGPHHHYYHGDYWAHRRWEERREWCYYHGC